MTSFSRLLDTLARVARRGTPGHSAAAQPGAIIKKRDGVDYISDLLELIDLPLIRMLEAVDHPGPAFYLRHDVDHDIDMALAMARAEHRAGYRSTYFLLTPGSYKEPSNYYGTIEEGKVVHAPGLVARCKELMDLGHEIGLHNDMVSLSFRVRRPPAELLYEEVEFFARNGIPLQGTAAHGNPLARQLGFNNKELFEGCYRKDSEPGRVLRHEGWTVALHSLKLQDFGFAYEAYSLPRDSRLSESGSKWGGRIAGVRPDWESLNARFDIDAFRSIIRMASASKGVSHFQVMTHPNHWLEK